MASPFLLDRKAVGFRAPNGSSDAGTPQKSRAQHRPTKIKSLDLDLDVVQTVVIGDQSIAELHAAI